MCRAEFKESAQPVKVPSSCGGIRPSPNHFNETCHGGPSGIGTPRRPPALEAPVHLEGVVLGDLCVLCHWNCGGVLGPVDSWRRTNRPVQLHLVHAGGARVVAGGGQYRRSAFRPSSTSKVGVVAVRRRIGTPLAAMGFRNRTVPRMGHRPAEASGAGIERGNLGASASSGLGRGVNTG